MTDTHTHDHVGGLVALCVDLGFGGDTPLVVCTANHPLWCPTKETKNHGHFIEAGADCKGAWCAVEPTIDEESLNPLRPTLEPGDALQALVLETSLEGDVAVGAVITSTTFGKLKSMPMGPCDFFLRLLQP